MSTATQNDEHKDWKVHKCEEKIYAKWLFVYYEA